MATEPYTLVRELGTGTWGTVYEAVATGGSDRAVAIKVLHPVWERHQTAAGALTTDVERLQAIDHPNIGRVEGLVTLSGRSALVMELVEGIDVGALVRRLRTDDDVFPARAALEVCGQVAAALDAAHSRGVLHRDLKPTNVMLTADALARVLDFGIARDDFDDAEAYTTSVRYGSLRYRSPERRAGGESAPPSDVYALGCVLYELLALRPFGNAELDPETHTERVAAMVAELAIGDDRVRALLIDMLAADPEARPDAAQIRARADELASDQPDEGLAMAAYNWVPEAAQMFEVDTNITADDTVQQVATGPVAQMEPVTAPLPPPDPTGSNAIGIVFGLVAVVALIGVLVLFG